MSSPLCVGSSALPGFSFELHVLWALGGHALARSDSGPTPRRWTAAVLSQQAAGMGGRGP